jgi:hypothetical protein
MGCNAALSADYLAIPPWVSSGEATGHQASQMASDWRTRWTHAQTRGRQIERQAAGLRVALVRLCDGQASASEVRLSVEAIRFQLGLVERMADDWETNPFSVRSDIDG